MPDITKCTNNRCPVAYKRYRMQSESNPLYQSYSIWYPDRKGKCGMFIKLTIEK